VIILKSATLDDVGHATSAFGDNRQCKSGVNVIEIVYSGIILLCTIVREKLLATYSDPVTKRDKSPRMRYRFQGRQDSSTSTIESPGAYTSVSSPRHLYKGAAKTYALSCSLAFTIQVGNGDAKIRVIFGVYSAGTVAQVFIPADQWLAHHTVRARVNDTDIGDSEVWFRDR
jgi:hypothetical protein